MAKVSKLNKTQSAVMDDIFSGQLDEDAIMAKHNISRGRYYKLLAEDEFRVAFGHRIALARMQSEAMIARYCSVAAAKLIGLTNSDKEETARKACLDIISLPNTAQRSAEPAEEADTDFCRPLSDQTASRLLQVLAEESD